MRYICIVLVLTFFFIEPLFTTNAYYYESTQDDVVQVELESNVSTSTEDIIVADDPKCSCVKGARHHGLNVPPADARDLVPNFSPIIGGGILLEYPNASHIAVITGFTDEGFEIVEWNYEPCEETRRVIAFNDHRIRGFVSY